MKYMEKDKSKKYGNQQNSLMVRYMTLRCHKERDQGVGSSDHSNLIL